MSKICISAYQWPKIKKTWFQMSKTCNPIVNTKLTFSKWDSLEVICNQILNNFIRIINAIETLKRQIDLVGNKDRWHIAVFISKPEGLCFVDMKTMETKKNGNNLEQKWGIGR